MDYKRAIEEFDKLTTDDERFREVYAHFGLAVFNAQILEQQVINLVVLAKLSQKKTATKEEIHSLWDSYDYGNRTLGMLLNEIKQIFSFSEEDLNDLKEILRVRNYITHDYFRHNAFVWYAEGGLKKFIKDFSDFIEKRVAIDAKLEKYLSKYMDRFGITPEAINKVVADQTAQWEKEIVDEKFKTFHK